MAWLDITYFTTKKVDALMDLAAEMPQYCALPAKDGKIEKFYFDPLMLHDVEQAQKDAAFKEMCSAWRKQMPKSWRDGLDLGYNKYNFDEDLLHYEIEFDGESENYATVTILLDSTYKGPQNKREINLLNVELDEILENPEPHSVYSYGEHLKTIYYENEDFWRQKLIRYVILNYLTD